MTPPQQCAFCDRPAASTAAKTCGSAGCRLRLVHANNGAGADQRCAVYRCYDTDGQLLYVGRSIEPEKRWAEHRRLAPWASAVVERKVEWFDAIADALHEEAMAIRHEAPVHNSKGTGSSSYIRSDLPPPSELDLLAFARGC